jgi:ABC-type uncharacterized transport system substrate-binding protein
MRLIGLAVFFTATILTFVSVAGQAQSAGKVYRLGILMPNPSSAFEQELRKLGYVEGQNILILRRYSHGGVEAVDRFARELVESRPDVIVVSSGDMARAVQRVSKTTPVVVTAASDLVAQGIVDSLAKPGGNVTGLQIMSVDLAGKRLELLREMVPPLARLAVLVPSTRPEGFAVQLRETELAAQRMGMQMDIMRVQERNDLMSAFKTLTRSRYDGLYVYSNSFTHAERREIARLAGANRMPAMYELREFVAAGGLVSYGPSTEALYRRAAVYADKILKGAKPADLPVEQPTKFEFVINLRKV